MKSFRERRLPTPIHPLLQESDKLTGDTVNGGLRALRLAVRTQGDAAAMTPAIVGALHNLDPSLAIAGIHTLQADIGTSTAPQRFNAALIGIYAAVALLLALVGIYGVLAYTVTQQMHEFGIRLALGAQRGQYPRLGAAPWRKAGDHRRGHRPGVRASFDPVHGQPALRRCAA